MPPWYSMCTNRLEALKEEQIIFGIRCGWVRILSVYQPRLFREEGVSMRKNRVLIIDHDLQTCKDIKYNVDSETTDAYYTLTVREGLAELANKDYDLVILNACFPENDGMELLKTLRGLKPMPILILSTSVGIGRQAGGIQSRR